VKKLAVAVKTILALAIIASLVIVLASDILNISPVTSTPPNSEDPGTPPDNNDKPNDKPNNNPGDNPGDVPPDEIIPDWSIKPTVVKNTLTDKKGNILCESRYSYPYVTSNDGSDVTAFVEALSKISSEIKEYVNARAQLYKLGTNDDFKVQPQITGYYTVNRFSSEIFSISFIFSEILPDGATRESRINYNLDILLSSNDITLDAIMNDAVSAVNSIIADKKSSSEFPVLYDNYEKRVESTIDTAWSVESNGILFLFPSGTLAPVSSGPIEIFIKNSELSSLLSEYGKILLNIAE